MNIVALDKLCRSQARCSVRAMGNDLTSASNPPDENQRKQNTNTL
jgi:hypothetical protein